MERLEAKRIHGHTYYYYSKWQWVDGRCRRVWQKYLGKPRDILRAVDGGGPPPKYAEVFQWGLPQALWQESLRCNIVDHVDRQRPKRDQGLSTGQYLAIAAINRAMTPQSKRSMWDWFSDTVLLRHVPGASKSTLTSQRFWDHMDRVDGQAALSIWQNILEEVLQREEIDLSRVCYDGTNFYTFIDTFNVRCKIARRGKNKQGRNNLRQVSYALFCSSDSHLPLYYDVYDGNRNDAKQFPLVLKRFHKFFQKLSQDKQALPNTTLIFDKGNNSKDNFKLLDDLHLSYVGSVKLEEHKELAAVKNNDRRFESGTEHPEGTKSFRVKKRVYGKPRLLIATFNQNLFHTQWLTVQNDVRKAVEQLSELRGRLEDRRKGLIKRGRPPTINSVSKQCETILSRQHMKKLIRFTVEADSNELPHLEYAIDTDAEQNLCDTYLGKTLLITDREEWNDACIIQAYRSQFIIEAVFKEMKDRRHGSWWPMFHWTDSKIKVHALYCTIALLIRALMLRRSRDAGLQISLERLLNELDALREVINIYHRQRGQKTDRRQTVLTRMTELQQQLVEILGLERGENAVLG